MKKIGFLFLVFVWIQYSAYSQLLDRVLRKVEDKVVDKTGEAIEKSTQKKDKKKTQTPDDSDNKEVNSSSESNDTQASEENGNALEAKPLKAYSKFDFIPGDKVIAYEDFSSVSSDEDLPPGWNTNASSEIVALNNYPGRRLALKGSSFSAFLPEYINNIPENATIEFEMIMTSGSSGLYVQIFKAALNRRQINWTDYRKDGVAIDLYGNWIQMESYIPDQPTFESNVDHSVNEIFDQNLNKKIKVSIWRQKERLRMYLNEKKVMDIPKAFNGSSAYNALQFVKRNDDDVYIRNIRVAIGNPDIRTKLAAGKFTTNGILFDVNEDKIKPESYGILKQIAEALKATPTLKVNVIGHTDSDGDGAKNLDLSKRRAIAVKNTLSNEFGIDASRMETDGKGATQPISPNTTTEGKANNRRVEFVKIS